MNSISPRIRTWEDYQKIYRFSLDSPDEFWASVAKYKLQWRKHWDQVADCDFKTARVRWYLGAELNVAENCLDRHLASGKGKQTALIWEGNDPNENRTYSFEELHREVCRFANVLESLGVRKGDRVVLYLPSIPEVAVSVLACARIGAVHSVIFGGFSAHSIQKRVEDCQAEMIITADGTYRGPKWIDLKSNVDEALAKGCSSVKKVIVVQRDGDKTNSKADRRFVRMPKDLLWNELMNDSVSCSHVAQSFSAEDPLFILYTSGSTGQPKGVLHKMGGYLTYVAYTHEIVFQPQEGDVFWCTADIGWITGHSYLLYGPLANGVTTIMFEGVPTYPDPGRFWQVVEKYNVNIFYTAPTAIRVLASAGDEYVKKYSRKSIRTLGSVGEPINPEAWRWYHQIVGDSRVPIVDTWWQTETGGILISPLAGITPLEPGSATLPLPGIEPLLLDEKAKVLTGNASGNLVLARSWPGQMTEVYGDPKRFYETYFSQYPGFYFTGDGAHRDEKNNYWITGRMDDVIKVSGHRIGTAEIESATLLHPNVVESAAVGVHDDVTGEAIHTFVVLRAGMKGSNKLASELSQVVRKEVGSIAHLKKVYWVPGLPKTRSGKIMRRILRKLATGETDQLGDTSTLSEPGIVDQMIQTLKE